MATSSVNPTTLLATPATGTARSLAVPDGFVDSLSKAIRREDSPVARRDRPQSPEPEQSVKRPVEQSTASAEADVEQDTANSQTESSAEKATVADSQEQEQPEEKSAAEISTDVVVISDQAKQQAAVANQEVVGEVNQAVEPVADGLPPSANGAPQTSDSALTMPSAAAGGSPQGLPNAQTAETTAQAMEGAAQQASKLQESALNQEPQNLTNGTQDTPPVTVNSHLQEDVFTEEQQHVGELGSAGPADGPTIAVQAVEGETGRRSSDDTRQPTSKVEPVLGNEAASATLEAEVDGPKLHTEVDTTQPETKDRPATATTNFPSVLERTSSLTSRRTAPQEAPSHPMPQVDAQRFVNRVSRAFQVAESRGGPLQLRLSPPELGALKIELSIQQGTLTAKLETETAAAKSVLMDNLPALRERLAAQEIRIDKFEVDVRQQNSGEQPNWQAQQDGEDARYARAVATGRRATAQQNAEATTGNATAPTRTHHNGQFSAVA